MIQRKEDVTTRKFSSVTSVWHSRKWWKRRAASRSQQQSENGRSENDLGIWYGAEEPEERNTFLWWNIHSVERRGERKKLAYARASARAISVAHARHALKIFYLRLWLRLSCVLSSFLSLGKQKLRVRVALYGYEKSLRCNIYKHSFYGIYN